MKQKKANEIISVGDFEKNKATRVHTNLNGPIDIHQELIELTENR